MVHFMIQFIGVRHDGGNMKIILSAIFIPVCIVALFSILDSSNKPVSKVQEKDTYVVQIPRIVLIIGAIYTAMSVIIILSFTFLSSERPPIVFYILFGGGVWIGSYLVLKTNKRKIIIKKEKITVYPLFSRPYTFDIEEVVFVQRQVKNNRQKSERIVIYTSGGKKLIVESLETSYFCFSELIKNGARPEALHGFE